MIEPNEERGLESPALILVVMAIVLVLLYICTPLFHLFRWITWHV